MKTFLGLTTLSCLLAITLVAHPAFAQAVAPAVACVPHNPYGLNFCPLIPVINDLIVTLGGILTAASPVIATYIVIYLRNHGIALKENAQKVIADRISATVQNGLKFAQSGADAAVQKLTISVPDAKIASAANYVIAQSPDLLKKAGIDITTDEGQQTIVRRVVAEMQPPPPNAPPSVDVNVKTL